MKIFNWLRRYSLFLTIISICFVMLLIGMKQNQQTDDQLTKGYFWVLSDSHVDTLYRDDGDPVSYCRNQSLNKTKNRIHKFGHVDCNSPIRLLLSAISAARTIDSNVDFVIWLGDSVAHFSSDENALITVNINFTQEFRKSFPRTLIIPILGNHDIIFTSNSSIRFSEFYKKTNYDLLLNDENARQTFLKGGYYSMLSPTNLRFIALNTAMFQPHLLGYFDSREASEQIEWFNQTLANASNNDERVLLLSHLPFGINENLLYRFYEIQYEEKLLSIMKKYSERIIMCLTAHRHQDTFRVYSSMNRTIGMLGHPSITPIVRLAHPSIRRYAYHRKSHVLIDYDQYSLNIDRAEREDLDQWKFAYRFSTWYHQNQQLTSQTLLELVHLIRRNSFYLRRFLITRHHADQPNLTNHTIIQALCALTLFHFDEFLFCTRFFEKKNIYYRNFTWTNISEINVFHHEQMMETRNLSRDVMIILVIVVVTVLMTSICCICR